MIRFFNANIPLPPGRGHPRADAPAERLRPGSGVLPVSTASSIPSPRPNLHSPPPIRLPCPHLHPHTGTRLHRDPSASPLPLNFIKGPLLLRGGAGPHAHGLGMEDPAAFTITAFEERRTGSNLQLQRPGTT